MATKKEIIEEIKRVQALPDKYDFGDKGYRSPIRLFKSTAINEKKEYLESFLKTIKHNKGV
jgi:hypothetical protein